MSETVIKGGTIVNEGRSFRGYIVIRGDRITEVAEGEYPGGGTNVIDAAGMIVMPGVIDDHVHFRQPGLTHKGDMRSESRAAVAGGVTSFMDMPNTIPQTTSRQEIEHKMELAAQNSAANYSFYIGATNDNLEEIRRTDPAAVCGVKLFMGSSTGNMLVDDEYSLSALFAESPFLIAAHCEYEPIIRANAEEFRQRCGDRATAEIHPLVRSAEACYRSSAQAVELADKYGANLHIMHLSTERELALFDAAPVGEKKITAEACVHHLWFSDADYERKGNIIKWNPAIKSAEDRSALRQGLLSGKIDIVATDHAPHSAEEKARPYWDCPSGGPMIQHSLPAMLELSREGVIPVERVVHTMCHAPAIRFGVRGRGFLRKGYFADIVIVEPDSPWAVSTQNILYKCGWSPMEGVTFNNRVVRTIVNGKTVYDRGSFDDGIRGIPLEFTR